MTSCSPTCRLDHATDAFRQRLQRQLIASRNIRVVCQRQCHGDRAQRARHSRRSAAPPRRSAAELRIHAKRFVLACGGLETARLLLASRSVQANGLGNEHDTVGRYYMDHPRAVFGRVKFSSPQKLPGLFGMPLADGMAQVGIQLTDAIQAREQLLNTYATVERYWSDQAARPISRSSTPRRSLLGKGYAGKRFSLSGAQLAKVPELIYLLAPREAHAALRCTASRGS